MKMLILVSFISFQILSGCSSVDKQISSNNNKTESSCASDKIDNTCKHTKINCNS